MNKEVYDFLLDMDIDANGILGVLTKDEDDVKDIVNRIIDAGKAEHAEECDKKHCAAIDGAIIKNMKAVLVSHEEYSTGTVIAVIAGVYLSLGENVSDMKPSSDGEMKEKLERMFGKGNVMVSRSIPDGFIDPDDDGKF